MQGLDLRRDVISPRLEDELAEVIRASMAHDQRPGGHGIDHVAGFLPLDACDNPIPTAVSEAMAVVEPFMGIPNSVIASHYAAGAHLPFHTDPPFWASPICVLNVGADVEISWSHAYWHTLTVKFPRRALMVMGGESRTDWHHGINEVTEARTAFVFRRRI